MPTQAVPLATPEDAARQLASQLAAGLARPSDAEPTPRAVALGLFRRHLARIQQSVREAFEQHELDGEAAAQALSAQTDGLIAGLHEFTLGDALGDEVALARAEGGHAGGQRTGQGTGMTLAVAATGGYGRGTLAPFSDIDLLFLIDEEPAPVMLRVVEFMLYFLWDLGLKVGHATRSVGQCIAEAATDTTIRTTLLDARRIAGDAAPFAMFQARLIIARAEAGPARFIADKQREREVRHLRYGESPFLVEPNIKEGRGGLRDLQTLGWLCRDTLGTGSFADLARPSGPHHAVPALLTEQEAKRARRSWDFLWTVRFHLHYIAGRAEERLTFDMQPVVGARMGYTNHGRQIGVERFMRHYFLTAREVMRLTHILEPQVLREALGAPALAPSTDLALLEAGLVLADGQIMPAAGVSFDATPIMMLRLLRVARERRLAIHPLAMHLLIRWERRAASLRHDPEANRILLELMCGERPMRRAHPERDESVLRDEIRRGEPAGSGARWLHVLNETGLLGRLIPAWSRIVGQMQFDTYHVFTVDEHTIEAVRILGTLEAGLLAEETPVANELVEDLQSRRSLYVATVMHDIAKGRGGDHSELGSEMALELCPRLGLSAEETETVSWLVLHHLLLSQTAFHRDIDDPKTILDLADTIQSPERLRLLLILTVIDMRAVSPKVWNAWKATLLRELYTRVAEVLAGGLATTERDVRVARAKEAASILLDEDGFAEDEIAHFLQLGYGGYWLSFDPETHARHARMIRESAARGAPLTVDTQPLPARAVTEVTIHTSDHPGLFSRIAGALAVAGASIVDARIHTMTDGMALDTFWVQDAAEGTFDAPHRLARLSMLVEQALSGRLDLDDEIAKSTGALMGRRMRAIHVPPRVVVDNRASNAHTVIEVNGRDRPGLLHDVTAAMSQQGLQIASAHITTYGVRAVDVFYVKDVFGLKVSSERKLDELRAALLAVLTRAEEAVAAAPQPSGRRRSLAS